MQTLRSLRRAADVTQERVAAMAGVHHATISKWEKGIVPLPLYAIPILARAFGVPRDDVTAAALASSGSATTPRPPAAG